MTVLTLIDLFALLFDPLLTVLLLGLNDDVPEDAEPLNRTHHLETSFNEISNKFRRFLITRYSVVRGRMLVLAGVINRNIGVWESDLYTFVRNKYSRTMSPGASTVIAMFPLLAWKGMTYFANGRGVLLVMQPLSPAPSPAPSSTPSGGVDFNKRNAAVGPCFIFLKKHGYCRVKRCRYRHDPADLAAPVAESMGDNRHSSASRGIAKPTTGGTGDNRNALGGPHNGSDGTRNGSTSRVGNAGTNSSSRAVVAWRGNCGGGGGRGGTRGGGGSSGGGGTASMSSSG